MKNKKIAAVIVCVVMVMGISQIGAFAISKEVALEAAVGESFSLVVPQSVGLGTLTRSTEPTAGVIAGVGVSGAALNDGSTIKITVNGGSAAFNLIYNDGADHTIPCTLSTTEFTITKDNILATGGYTQDVALACDTSRLNTPGDYSAAITVSADIVSAP